MTKAEVLTKINLESTVAMMNHPSNKFLQVDFLTTAKLIEMDGWVAFRNLIKYNMEERFTAH